jgi:hypothetical protein
MNLAHIIRENNRLHKYLYTEEGMIANGLYQNPDTLSKAYRNEMRKLKYQRKKWRKR